MSEIEFKIPHKTIYSDIVGMPDPMILGTTIKYYNHSDRTLYFKFAASGPTGWSSNEVTITSLTTGTSGYYNAHAFLSRTKPTSATTEQLSYVLKAYTDAGYTDLFAQYSRQVTVIFIKSDDGSWTTDFSNNFDDGTVQGWDGRSQQGDAYAGVSAQTDYALSPAYSLRQYGWDGYTGYRWFEMHKTFQTPSRTTVYVIANVRVWGATEYTYHSNPDAISIRQGGIAIITIGGSQTHTIPESKWMRIVAPLTSNVNQEIAIRFVNTMVSYQGLGELCYHWLDDFKIISK